MRSARRVVVSVVVLAVFATGCSLREVQAWFSLRGATVSEQQARDVADKVNAQSAPGCDANYSGFCVPNNQTNVRCAGGPGSGPEIGAVRVVGWDHFGLDPDGDKLACDQPAATPAIVPPTTAPPATNPPSTTTPPPTTTTPTTTTPTTTTPTTTTPPPTTTAPTTTTTTTTTVPTTPSEGTSFMYVGDTILGAVRKIDTVSLRVVDTYDLGGVLVGNIAVSGNRIFYTSSTTSPRTIGVYDMATRSNNRTYASSNYSGLYLRTSPALPDRLFTASSSAPSLMFMYDTSGPSGVYLGMTAHGTLGGFVRDYETSADGTRLWAAATTPQQLTEFRTSDLVPTGKRFPTGRHPQSVDSTQADGKEWIAGSGTDGVVWVFDAADPAIATSTAVGGETVAGALAFNREGSKLFTAVETANSSRLVTIDRATGRTSNAPLVGNAPVAANSDVAPANFGVDPGTGRVFFAINNSIVVYNPDGTYGRTIGPVGTSSIVFSATAPTSTPLVLVPTSLPNEGPPVISSFSVSRSWGTAPVTTAFSWSISDPDGSPLTCELDVDDDGTPEFTIPNCTSDSTRAVTVFTPDDHGRPRLTVSDGSQRATRTTSLTVYPPSADPYGITVRPNGLMTPSQLAAFTTAANRWAQVVRTGLTDTSISVPADACVDGAPAFSGVVDDLMIDAIITPIDGPDGILGAAGPCIVQYEGLPVYGVMIFDSADVAQLEAEGSFSTVVLHEMGHVMGIGSTAKWDDLVAGSGGSNPVFTGSVARAEWSRLGNPSASVPLENTGGPGTAEAHWRESVFDDELMTGWLNPGSNPLSRVTIGALADLGYGVDLAAADPPAPAGAVAAFRAMFAPRREIATERLRPRLTVG